MSATVDVLVGSAIHHPSRRQSQQTAIAIMALHVQLLLLLNISLVGLHQRLLDGHSLNLSLHCTLSHMESVQSMGVAMLCPFGAVKWCVLSHTVQQK